MKLFIISIILFLFQITVLLNGELIVEILNDYSKYDSYAVSSSCQKYVDVKITDTKNSISQMNTPTPTYFQPLTPGLFIGRLAWSPSIGVNNLTVYVLLNNLNIVKLPIITYNCAKMPNYTVESDIYPWVPIGDNIYSKVFNFIGLTKLATFTYIPTALITVPSYLLCNITQLQPWLNLIEFQCKFTLIPATAKIPNAFIISYQDNNGILKFLNFKGFIDDNVQPYSFQPSVYYKDTRVKQYRKDYYYLTFIANYRAGSPILTDGTGDIYQIITSPNTLGILYHQSYDYSYGSGNNRIVYFNQLSPISIINDSFVSSTIALPTPNLTPVFNFITGNLKILQNTVSNVPKDYPVTFQFHDYIYTLSFNYPYFTVSHDNTTNISILFPSNPGNYFQYNGANTLTLIGATEDTSKPSITNIEFIEVDNQNLIATVTAKDNYGVLKIVLYNSITIPNGNLINGTIQNGVFEILFNYREIKDSSETITIYDINGNIFTYSGYIGIIPIPKLPNSLSSKSSVDKPRIKDVRFLVNSINLDYIGCNNTIYFTFDRVITSKLVYFEILLKNNELFDGKLYKGSWNPNSNSFSIDFYLPPRLISGSIKYRIYYPNLVFESTILTSVLGSSADLVVISNNGCTYPPVIELIEFDKNNLIWNITITDNSNGFKYGVIHLKSSLDNIPQVFNITQLQSSIQFKVNTGAQQTISMEMVKLVDKSGWTSLFYDNLNTNGINPFIQIMNSSFRDVSYNDTVINDLAGPTMVSVSSASTTYSISADENTRRIQINYQITDPAGISLRHRAKCYLATLFDVVESDYSEEVRNVTDTSVEWKCIIVVPIGFAFSTGKAYLSISGYSDTLLNFGYASTSTLKLGPFIYEFTFTNNPAPYLESYLPIPSNQTFLTIFGDNFIDGAITITDSNGVSSQPSVSNVQILSKNVLIINSIRPNQITFNVSMVRNSIPSNILQVFPIVDPTKPPIVTFKCPNNCTSPSQGICKEGGCECIYPWSSSDCSLKLVITDPTINTTSPEANTTLDIVNGLIKISELNEIDYQGNLIASHRFRKWDFKNLTSTLPDSTHFEYLYTTIIPYRNLNTTINIYIEIYKKSTTIYFANEPLNMVPSSIKYRIEFNSYSFVKPLNSLELVMEVSINSNEDLDESCTYSNFNNNSSTNNDFIHLQINSHTLYGRFIKKAVIDNRIQSIANRFINSSSNDQSTSSKSYLAIKIPNYQSNVAIDPDFSMLIDPQDSTTPTSGSVCYSKDQKKSLTKIQLIGIIIGSACAGLLLILGFIYYKYKYNSIFKHNIQKVFRLKKNNNLNLDQTLNK